MIKRDKQVITQRYNGEKHRGLDLRCVNTFGLVQPVVAPEDAVIIRNSIENGVDGFGNHYVVYRVDSGHVMKSIHVKPEKGIKNGVSVIKWQLLGWPVIGGNSKSLHEHWELWSEDEREYYDPTRYLIANHFDFEYKACV